MSPTFDEERKFLSVKRSKDTNSIDGTKIKHPGTLRKIKYLTAAKYILK
jgi:hypothetical protein